MPNWLWPLSETPEVPKAPHPGAFGIQRRHLDFHTGVDLYASRGAAVVAVESGVVVRVETFTGERVGSPWWETTWAVLIEGASGVVCYGEIYPYVMEGVSVSRGQLVGYVEQVLREGQERLDIPGHGLSMLHVELYEHGVRETGDWPVGGAPPRGIQDPTYLLVGARASR